MARPTAPRPLAALEVLLRHDVEFIVVGMMAGVLHGALVTTLEAGRPKDLAALPVLRQTLQETKKRQG